MNIDHIDLEERFSALADRFLQIHTKQHLEKAANLSSFLRGWSERARSITTADNIRENILPAAFAWFETRYPVYGSEARQILTTILLDEDIDWPALTDELYQLVARHSAAATDSTFKGHRF